MRALALIAVLAGCGIETQAEGEQTDVIRFGNSGSIHGSYVFIIDTNDQFTSQRRVGAENQPTRVFTLKDGSFEVLETAARQIISQTVTGPSRPCLDAGTDFIEVQRTGQDTVLWEDNCSGQNSDTLRQMEDALSAQMTATP